MAPRRSGGTPALAAAEAPADAEINAWLMDRCIEDAKKQPHPEIPGKTVWQVAAGATPGQRAPVGIAAAACAGAFAPVRPEERRSLGAPGALTPDGDLAAPALPVPRPRSRLHAARSAGPRQRPSPRGGPAGVRCVRRQRQRERIMSNTGGTRAWRFLKRNPHYIGSRTRSFSWRSTASLAARACA